MKNSKKGFLVGVLAGLVSSLSNSSVYLYNGHFDYSSIGSLPYNAFLDVSEGIWYFFYWIPWMIPILFSFLCGVLGHLIGSAFEEIRGTSPERTLGNFLWSYKWVLVVACILLWIYPLYWHLEGIQNPGVICSADYVPETGEGCVKNYADIYKALVVNIFYIFIFLGFFISLLRFFTSNNPFRSGAGRSITKKKFVTGIIVPILILAVFGILYSRQLPVSYTDHSVADCQHIKEAWYKSQYLSRNACVLYVANHTKDCALITFDQEKRNSCYNSLGVCANIDDVELRDFCYLASRESGGAKSCSSITDSVKKQFCFQYLGVSPE